MTVKELRATTYLKVKSVRILNDDGSDKLIDLREDMENLRDFDDYEVDEVRAVIRLVIYKK